MNAVNTFLRAFILIQMLKRFTIHFLNNYFDLERPEKHLRKFQDVRAH